MCLTWGAVHLANFDRKAGIIGPISCQMIIREAAGYAPRRYGRLQENVFFGVMGLVTPLPVRNLRSGTKTTTSIGPDACHYLRDATPVVSRDGSI